MSSYTPHMNKDQELYRGVLAYEFTPTRWVPDPSGALDYYNRPKQIQIPTGPEETKFDIIGPYVSTGPIKSYVTRRRGQYKNLRIERVERAVGWEEVTL